MRPLHRKSAMQRLLYVRPPASKPGHQPDICVVNCSGVRFVLSGAHSRCGGITFTHIGAAFRGPIKSGASEVVDPGFQCDPHDSIGGAAGLCLRFSCKLVRCGGGPRSAGSLPCGRSWRRNWPRRRSSCRGRRCGSGRCCPWSGGGSRRLRWGCGRLSWCGAAATFVDICLFGHAGGLIGSFIGSPFVSARFGGLLSRNCWGWSDPRRGSCRSRGGSGRCCGGSGGRHGASTLSYVRLFRNSVGLIRGLVCSPLLLASLRGLLLGDGVRRKCHKREDRRAHDSRDVLFHFFIPCGHQ
jgi:hypothetical protein